MLNHTYDNMINKNSLIRGESIEITYSQKENFLENGRKNEQIME
jgi:hypothetical protein